MYIITIPLKFQISLFLFFVLFLLLFKRKVFVNRTKLYNTYLIDFISCMPTYEYDNSVEQNTSHKIIFSLIVFNTCSSYKLPFFYLSDDWKQFPALYVRHNKMLINCYELQHWYYKISHSCYYLYIFPHTCRNKKRGECWGTLIVIGGRYLYLQLMSYSLQKIQNDYTTRGFWICK